MSRERRVFYLWRTHGAPVDFAGDKHRKVTGTDGQEVI